MRLRTKLLVLQTAASSVPLAVMAGLLTLLLVRTDPLLRQGIESKASACLRRLLPEMDLALAAGDRRTVREHFSTCAGAQGPDPDLSFIVVEAQGGERLASTGAAPRVLDSGHAGQPRVQATARGYRGEAAVSLEGRLLEPERLRSRSEDEDRQ